MAKYEFLEWERDGTKWFTWKGEAIDMILTPQANNMYYLRVNIRLWQDSIFKGMDTTLLVDTYEADSLDRTFTLATDVVYRLLYDNMLGLVKDYNELEKS